MIFNLRKDIAWVEVRLNRRRVTATVKHCGRHSLTLESVKDNGWDFVLKEFWAGPLVVRLEHWRTRDA